MNIGIIGAGNVGRALAGACVTAGHNVGITSANPGEAAAVAADVGAAAVESNHGVVADADAIILAVPFEAVEDVVRDLGAVLDGRVVVEVSNRFDPEQLDAPSNAELTQRMAAGARVVKAFNTVFAANQPDPVVDGVRLDGFFAGDDVEAKGVVRDLLRSLGYRPVDCGPLAMARALEGMGVLNISLNMTHGWPWRTGWKLVGPMDGGAECS